MIVGLQTPGQRRGRKSAVGQKTDARARFPRYAVDDVPGRRRALQLLRALDRGLPSAALFRICGAAKRRCRPALAIGLGSGSALCVPAQSMLLYAGAEARTEVRALPSQMPSLGQANPVGFSRLYPASHQGRRAMRSSRSTTIRRRACCSMRAQRRGRKSALFHRKCHHLGKRIQWALAGSTRPAIKGAGLELL